MSITKKASAGVAAIALTLGMSAGPANAQVTQDGLVNVNVGDVTIEDAIDVNAAAELIVQLCGVNVNAVVGVLAIVEQVDQTDRSRTLCRADGGNIRVVNN